ncbi:small secreted protein [Rutstroemia sp. NJR-2017a WRK4]|nr:small secreted protein [Rutstroemia sp. NJR-2017a WRK4]
MRFSAAFVLLLTVVSASPLPKKEKAAASSSVSSAVASSTAAAASSTSTATAATGGSVLTAAAYNDFQISSGTAGDAQTKANALFSAIDMNNLASVSAADLKIIKGIHDAAEDAEVQAFNPAIKAASGDAATALQNGKIQNKVLKLTAEVLGIQVEAAQGGDDSDLAAEQTKLANNIKLDTAAAGQASTAVPFDGTS